MKTCFKCKKAKPLTSFYKHPKMKDGHLNKCIKCTKLDVKRRYYSPEGYEKVMAYEKSRSKLPHRKALNYSIGKQYRENNPGRKRANTIVGNAIRDGKIQRLPCEVCGSVKSEAHHTDYRRPLMVQWLCKLHHERTHHKNGHLHPIQ